MTLKVWLFLLFFSFLFIIKKRLYLSFPLMKILFLLWISLWVLALCWLVVLLFSNMIGFFASMLKEKKSSEKQGRGWHKFFLVMILLIIWLLVFFFLEGYQLCIGWSCVKNMMSLEFLFSLLPFVAMLWFFLFLMKHCVRLFVGKLPDANPHLPKNADTAKRGEIYLAQRSGGAVKQIWLILLLFALVLALFLWAPETVAHGFTKLMVSPDEIGLTNPEASVLFYQKIALGIKWILYIFVISWALSIIINLRLMFSYTERFAKNIKEKEQLLFLNQKIKKSF